MEFITILLIIVPFSIYIVFKNHFSLNRKLRLPPGSLGWPYIGETFQLYSQNPNVFFTSKIKMFVQIHCIFPNFVNVNNKKKKKKLFFRNRMM